MCPVLFIPEGWAGRIFTSGSLYFVEKQDNSITYTRRTWVFRFWSVIRAPGQGIATSHSQDYGEGGTDRFHGRTSKCAQGRQAEQDSAACRDNAAMGREGCAPERKTQV